MDTTVLIIIIVVVIICIALCIKPCMIFHKIYTDKTILYMVKCDMKNMSGLKKCSSPDEMIIASNTTLRNRVEMTPEALTKWKQLVKKFQDEKGSPPVIHEIRKYNRLNSPPEFEPLGYENIHIAFLPYW